MDTEAINTWGVCLSWQLDGAGRETLPGPVSRPSGGHNAGAAPGRSGREGQDLAPALWPAPATRQGQAHKSPAHCLGQGGRRDPAAT